MNRARNSPKIIFDPSPRMLAQICDAESLVKLRSLGQLVISDDAPMPDAMVDAHLTDAELIIGQTALPRTRLQ